MVARKIQKGVEDYRVIVIDNEESVIDYEVLAC